MTKLFERRAWSPKEDVRNAGASALNRIEAGIELSAEAIERVGKLERLSKGAKAADITKAFNELLSAITGNEPEETEDPDESGGEIDDLEGQGEQE